MMALLLDGELIRLFRELIEDFYFLKDYTLLCTKIKADDLLLMGERKKQARYNDQNISRFFGFLS